MNWGALCGLLLLTFMYLKYHRFLPGDWLKPFGVSLAVLVICFFSPLHILSQEYLFTAHMIVHVVLLLIAGPLLVVSLVKNEKPNNFISRLSAILFRKPVIGWLAGVGIMWFWHLPPVFNTAMHAGHSSFALGFVITSFESISLIVAGMLFGWSLVSPVKEFRLPALHGVVYLFTACIGCSILGLLITFAPAGTFRHFLSSIDSYHLNNVILNQWQINQAVDQQIAGLIMWVPCCLLYVVYALYLLTTWFNEKDVVKPLDAQ
jgi:cytochrome c oxidase assembly factor CtaG